MLNFSYVRFIIVEQFRQFLETFLARYKDARKILLVLDNAQTHHSKEVEPILAANRDKFELLFLPPYFPDLNPMEYFWKFLWK